MPSQSPVCTCSNIGLGRYGDPIDLAGYSKGFNNLTKLLKPGGTLYLSTPFAIERIEYNAHRVFALKTIVNLIEAICEVVYFAMVDDSGELHDRADLNATLECSGTYRFALAIFELRKRVWRAPAESPASAG
jgi:Caenorhabditis protein of unknown function, DUF268